MKTISERACELYQDGQEADFYGDKHGEITPMGALVRALDEWQATVESRLREIEQHPALSIPPLRLPPTRPPSLPPTQADLTAALRANASKYEPEPVESEE